MTRACIDCLSEKPLSEFYKTGKAKISGKQWHTIMCKKCYMRCYSPGYGKPNAGQFKNGNNPWNKKSENDRGSIVYIKWRDLILKSDNYTCQECSSIHKLHVHHIKGWEEFPELKFKSDNGITLCMSCHAKLHGKLKCNPIKNGTSWNKGKKMSKEHCKKLSESHKGQIAWNKGLITKKQAEVLAGDLA